MPIKEISDLTKSLVNIPINNSEMEAGTELVDWLRKNTSAEVKKDGSGNILARKGTGGPSLAFVGHHDVVDPAESQVKNNRLLVNEGSNRIFGRGTADMKGALAAMMLAFQEADPNAELIFASFIGEEKGGVGAQAAIEEGFVPDFAIVGEGSASYSKEGVLDVGIAHKGRRGSLIHASGKSAHASEPSDGENAIYRGMEAVNEVRSLDTPKETIFGKEIAGSLAVTEIDGGTNWNTIPDSCEVTVDERTVPGKRADLEIIESIEGVGYSVEQDLPPMRCDSNAFARLVLEAAENNQTGSANHIIKPHATDAGWLSKAGTDCIVCGPAEPGEAHSANESVSKSLLNTAYQCYFSVAENWNLK